MRNFTISNPIRVSSPQIGEEEANAVAEVIRSGWISGGDKVQEFERKFARAVGCDYALAMNSGTAALHSALSALGIGPGDEVVVPALSFFATVEVVMQCGAIPVILDVEPQYWCLDVDEHDLTDRTRAIIPVHFLGNVANLMHIREVADDWDIPVIEDASQAHGATLYGKPVGSWGAFGCFSMFATKHITLGEGGVITCNSKEDYDWLFSFRCHGMQGRDNHAFLGYNYKISDIIGAMGACQVDKMEKINERRIHNSKQIIEGIEDCPVIHVQREETEATHTYFWTPILVDTDELGVDIERVREYLLACGIETRKRYNAPLNQQKAFLDYMRRYYPDEVIPQTPIADFVAPRIIGLPARADLTQEEIDHIVIVVNEMKEKI